MGQSVWGNMVFIISLFLLWFRRVYCLEKDMTISIDPKKKNAFLKMSLPVSLWNWSIKYCAAVCRLILFKVYFFESSAVTIFTIFIIMVIDGGQGDLDINFRFISPSGNIIASDFKRMENVIRVGSTEEGHYQMCWDNSFSHFNSKTIFFEILINEDDDDDNVDDVWDHFDGLSPEEFYEIKVQDIQAVLDQVRANLNKIKHLQDILRASESRDRSIAEGNFVRVNYWSMVQIAVMLVVGLIQVVMVRNLFDHSSKVSRLLKGKFSS